MSCREGRELRQRRASRTEAVAGIATGAHSGSGSAEARRVCSSGSGRPVRAVALGQLEKLALVPGRVKVSRLPKLFRALQDSSSRDTPRTSEPPVRGCRSAR